MNGTFWKVFAVMATIIIAFLVIFNASMPRYKIMSGEYILDSWTGNVHDVDGRCYKGAGH